MKEGVGADLRRIVLADDRCVEYTVRRTRRRGSIGLQVDERGLTVTVPPRGASARWIEEALRERADWLLEKLDEWRGRARPAPDFREGSVLPYLGRDYRLALNAAPGRGRVMLLERHLLATLPEPHAPDRVERLVMRWYHAEALALFGERARALGEPLGLVPRSLRLSGARTRWGSCNERGEIRINWRLIHRPLHLVDYVAAHELAHLAELNHSAAFWALVERMFPRWREARAELRRGGGEAEA